MAVGALQSLREQDGACACAGAGPTREVDLAASCESPPCLCPPPVSQWAPRARAKHAARRVASVRKSVRDSSTIHTPAAAPQAGCRFGTREVWVVPRPPPVIRSPTIPRADRRTTDVVALR